MPSSTSNSKDRAPSLPWLRDAIWAVVALAMLGTALMAVSAYLDPFDLRLSPWRADADRLESYRRRNEPLWAAAELERQPPEAFGRARYVVLGDSRCRQLTSNYAVEGGRFVEIAGAPVLNLAFGGASISESVDIFARFAGALRSLRAIILCTPIDWLGTLGASGRVDDALGQAAQPWRYLLDLNTIMTFFEPLGPRSDPRGGKARLAPKSPIWRRTVAHYCTAVEQLRLEAVERSLEAAIDRLRSTAGADVRLIFYLPPMTAEIETAYRRQGKLYRQVLERLSERGTVYDFALFDGVGSSFEFGDPVHLVTDSRPILEDIVTTFEGRRKLSRFAAGGASPLFAGGR